MNDGPTVKLELSCFDCKYVRTEREFDEQGDSDRTVYCDHPALTFPGHVGGHCRTPAWCPLRSAAITAAMKPLGFVSVEAIKNVRALLGGE